MEKTRTLPQIYFQSNQYYYKSAGAYLIGDVDKEQADKHQFTGDDGSDYMIYIPTATVVDERRKHPNIGTIYGTGGDTCFPIGARVIVEHNSFRSGMNPFNVFYTDEDGNDYYNVINRNVLFMIDGDRLIPRKYVLLCEPVLDKLYDTSLYLPGDKTDFRRDIAIVHSVWDGCTEYEKGDILLIAKNSDYPVSFNNKRFIKIDTDGDHEVLAKVDSLDWRYKEVHEHIRR